MSILRTKLQFIFFFFVLVAGFGCVNGSGNSAGEAPFAVYTGSITPADITLDNSAQIVDAIVYEIANSDALGSVGFSLNTGDSSKPLNVNHVQKIIHRLNNAIKKGIKTGPHKRDKSSESGSLPLSFGEFESLCDNPRGRILFTGDLDTFTFEYNGTAQFVNCTIDGLTTNGTISGSNSNYDARIDAVTLVDSYINLNIQGADIFGTVDIALTGTSYAEIIVTDIDSMTTESVNYDIVDYSFGEQFLLEDFVTVGYAPILLSPEDYDFVSYDGRVYLSSLGYLDVTTATDLIFSNGTISQFFPDGGGPLVIFGDTGDSIEVLPNTDEISYQLSIDANGDGFAESITMEFW